MKIIPILWAAMSLLILSACVSQKPKGNFDVKKAPPAPDYSKTEHWAALPSKVDMADDVPTSLKNSSFDSMDVDVFYLHPTIYWTGKDADYNWNAPIENAKVNQKTEKAAIRNQASIFNEGRVYAPRYRQAHLYSFYAKDQKAEGDKALDLAYLDVKAAFLYYLEHYNQGRPIILASHSQGTRHAMLLLKEFFDGKPLSRKLVVAYLAGYPVPRSYYSSLKPCETPTETECFCTWRTWERKHILKKGNQPEIFCTNPILWTLDTTYAPKTLHEGAVLQDFNRLHPKICDAQVYKGFLAVKKPKFPGSIFLRRKNYHIGDLNLFYLDVRKNAKKRYLAFKKK